MRAARVQSAARVQTVCSGFRPTAPEAHQPRGCHTGLLASEPLPKTHPGGPQHPRPEAVPGGGSHVKAQGGQSGLSRSPSWRHRRGWGLCEGSWACPREGPLLPAPSPRQAAQGTPTLSLYLLEANLRALADPEGPRPCFRSCMVTSWLPARGPWQGFGIRGCVFLPPPLPGVRGPAAPWSDLLGKPLPIPPSGRPSSPAPDRSCFPERVKLPL